MKKCYPYSTDVSRYAATRLSARKLLFCKSRIVFLIGLFVALFPSAYGDSSEESVSSLEPTMTVAQQAAMLLQMGYPEPIRDLKFSAQLGCESKRDFFDIPEAALVRPLGDVAENKSAPMPVPHAGLPGLGIPVGGFGAGSFMVNQCGTFGPWAFGGLQSNSWETRALPQAAFHVREVVADAGEDAKPTIRTLATQSPLKADEETPVWDSPLPAWNLSKAGEGIYGALYPFGYLTYDTFETDVSIRFFSPIESGQDRRTSLPVVYFDVRLANHTDVTRTLSVMFSMPNAPAHVKGTNADPSVPNGPESIRKGFSSEYLQQGNIHAVALRADCEENTPDAANSEWTIAVLSGNHTDVSYATSWNAEGNGEDVYAPFSNEGRLPDVALDNTASAGALCVTVTLEPGAVETIPFVLAWDFPTVAFAENTSVWMRRYTNFYGAKTTLTNEYIQGSYPFYQGFAIARDALQDHDQALSSVLKWWEPIATEKAYSPLLRCAALNQLA